MGKNSRKPVLSIRYRKKGKVFGTKLTFSKNGGKKLKGRVLSVRKLPKEKLLRVGSYLPFDPEALLREFREAEREKRREVKVNAEEGN